MITRKLCLEQAEICVNGQREEDYGKPEDNFNVIADMWNAYLNGRFPTDIFINAVDVSMMMGLLKIARVSSGRTNPDSFIDLAGYAACACEIATKNDVKSSKDDDEVIFGKK